MNILSLNFFFSLISLLICYVPRMLMRMLLLLLLLTDASFVYKNMYIYRFIEPPFWLDPVFQNDHIKFERPFFLRFFFFPFILLSFIAVSVFPVAHLHNAPKTSLDAISISAIAESNLDALLLQHHDHHDRDRGHDGDGGRRRHRHYN